jgi:hypothetical protein
LSNIKGPFSIAPCQTLISIRNFFIAVGGVDAGFVPQPSHGGAHAGGRCGGTSGLRVATREGRLPSKRGCAGPSAAAAAQRLPHTTGQSLCARATSHSRGAPSSPTASWPSSRSALRYQPPLTARVRVPANAQRCLLACWTSSCCTVSGLRTWPEPVLLHTLVGGSIARSLVVLRITQEG